MFVTSNGLKQNTGIPKKGLNKEKSELSQICSTMKKRFYKNLTSKQKHMAVIYGGFWEYRIRYSWKVKQQLDKNVFFQLFSRQITRLFGDITQEYLFREPNNVVNNNDTRLIPEFFKDVNDAYDCLYYDKEKLLRHRMDLYCTNNQALKDSVLDYIKY